ncbi:hypothetical protein L3Q72_12740 [Vibrio sp. JC009]|uniref:hypothetical protein n=1 Tax=Vibrio sp. JC009 TaxID=2912314 RepID=UPI0023AF1633|nr:hypothetical protein [Vibrio sp. JC009]WED21483.1 hypothetical protein L3Q72_12740 [Vibrio sp. JC009]
MISEKSIALAKRREKELLEENKKGNENLSLTELAGIKIYEFCVASTYLTNEDIVQKNYKYRAISSEIKRGIIYINMTFLRNNRKTIERKDTSLVVNFICSELNKKVELGIPPFDKC